MDENDLKGLWAVDGAGRIGKISGRTYKRGLHLYVGQALDGSDWSSACPHVLAFYEQRALTSLQKLTT
jgi:hypothetical protein